MHWLTKKNEGEKEVKKNERKKERGKKTRKKEEQKNHLELRGIDPRTSHMLSERSTIWATAPADITCTCATITKLSSSNGIHKNERLLAGSNHRPLVYKTSALATELKSHWYTACPFVFRNVHTYIVTALGSASI